MLKFNNCSDNLWKIDKNLTRQYIIITIRQSYIFVAFMSFSEDLLFYLSFTFGIILSNVDDSQISILSQLLPASDCYLTDV